MGPPSRSEWIMAALVLLAMFLWICGSNLTISLPLLGSNFINPTMVVFVDLADAGHGRDRLRRHRRREERLGGVLLHFTSLLTLSSA